MGKWREVEPKQRGIQVSVGPADEYGHQTVFITAPEGPDLSRLLNWIEIWRPVRVVGPGISSENQPDTTIVVSAIDDSGGRSTPFVTNLKGSDLSPVLEWLSTATRVQAVASPITFQITPSMERITEARLKVADAWAQAFSTYGVFGVGRLSELSKGNILETEKKLLRQAGGGVLLTLVVSVVDANRPILLFPAFQFDQDGEILPVMSAIASRLANAWDIETRLLWLTSPNGWLAKQAPADLLAENPEAVLRALELAMSAA